MSNNTFINNTWVKEEISRVIFKYFKLMKMKTQYIKICGMQ